MIAVQGWVGTVRVKAHRSFARFTRQIRGQLADVCSGARVRAKDRYSHRNRDGVATLPDCLRASPTAPPVCVQPCLPNDAYLPARLPVCLPACLRASMHACRPDCLRACVSAAFGSRCDG